MQLFFPASPGPSTLTVALDAALKTDACAKKHQGGTASLLLNKALNEPLYVQFWHPLFLA